MNYFRNGQFNLDVDGTTTYEQAPGLRLPHWWRLGWVRQPNGDWRADVDGIALPLEGQSEQAFDTPEVRTSGGDGVTIGGAWRPVWWWLEQDVTLAAGEYRLSFDVLSLVNDPNPLACEYRFRVGSARTAWEALEEQVPPVGQNILVGDETMPIGLEVRGRYGLEKNFVRMYGASLIRLDAPQPAAVSAPAYAPVDWRGVLPADGTDDGLIDLGGVDELTYMERLADSAITAGLQIRYLARQMRARGAGDEN